MNSISLWIFLGWTTILSILHCYTAWGWNPNHRIGCHVATLRFLAIGPDHGSECTVDDGGARVLEVWTDQALQNGFTMDDWWGDSTRIGMVLATSDFLLTIDDLLIEIIPRMVYFWFGNHHAQPGCLGKMVICHITGILYNLIWCLWKPSCCG